MSDIAQKILSQASLVRMPSLPELLLCELETFQHGNTLENGQNTDLESLVAGDLFLYGRLLASSAVADNNAYYSPARLVQQHGYDNLKMMVRQTAAAMSFSRPSADQLRFMKQLYLQSLLTRSLAQQIARDVLPESKDKLRQVEQAAFCGLFLNIGALTLEQGFSRQYLDMLRQSENTSALLMAEQKEFGIDHGALGAALLASWGIDGRCCDALRYHHLDINQILDATPLVKIAWLANQLTDEKENPEAQVWADTLFELQEDSLVKIRETARATVQNSSKSFNIAFSTTRYLPLPVTEEEHILKQEKFALKQLRLRSEADNLFALAKDSLFGADEHGLLKPEKFGQAISASSRMLFGNCESLLFVLSDDGKFLRCVTATPAIEQVALDQLVICCEGDRSVVARSCLHNEPVLRLPMADLSVIDRQLLTLLGSDNYCCEPLPGFQVNSPCGVLVIGIPGARVESYKKQSYLRNDFCTALGRMVIHRQEDRTEVDDVAASYERRIKETIHEANNPLGIIKNYLQLLSMKQGEDTKIQSEISFIKSEIDRVSNILEKLKEKPGGSDQATTLNINLVIRNLVSIFSGSFAAAESINIETNLDPALPEINCNENAVRQIITNLVKNSAEAFEDGGTILVKTAGNYYMNGTRYIQVIVKDNGPGIAANILKKLFLPDAENSNGNSPHHLNVSSGKNTVSNISSNISTKGGSHTGSGLSIVHSLAKELGGQVSCQTTRFQETGQDSHGTEITVLLPVSSVGDSNTISGDLH